MDPTQAVTDHVMISISKVIVVKDHVVAQRVLTEGPEEQDDLQTTYHLIQVTADLQSHITDK